MKPEPSGDDSPEPATRRELLRASGAAGLALLAGCTEDVGEEFPPNAKWPTADARPTLPVRERTAVLEDGIEETAGAEVGDLEAFAAAIEEYAFEVESIERDRDVVTVEYVTAESPHRGDFHGVGPVAGAYAALIDAGYDAVALGVTILDAAPVSYGAAEVTTAWADAFNAGDLSTAEYAELVAATVESKRHPPEVDVAPDE